MTRPILILSIFNSVIKMLTVSLAFFLAIYLKSIGFSGSQIGIAFALAEISSIVTILPSGFSNDTFKSKNLIAIALIFFAIQYIGISATNSFPLMAVLFFFGGMGSALYMSSSESLFYKSTKKENISRKIGFFQSINYIMIGIGMITAGYLLNLNIPFEKLFLIIGITFIIAAGISKLILPENETSKLEILHYKKDLFKPQVTIFMLIIFLFAIHFGSETTSYGLFLENNLKFSKFGIGAYMGIAIIVMGPTAFLIGKKLRKFKAKNVLLFGLFCSGLGHIFMTIPIIKTSFIFRTIHEIGDASMIFFLFYGITQLFDLKRIGGNAGIFQFTSRVGGSIGALIFGIIGAKYGYNWPFIISGSTNLLAFIIATQYIHHFDHK